MRPREDNRNDCRVLLCAVIMAVIVAAVCLFGNSVDLINTRF